MLFLIFSFPMTLFLETVIPVHAEILPIKINQDRGSETWLLPDGNVVTKIGGEAKTNFFDNSTDSWKPSKVTAIDGNSFKVQSGLISTVFDDDIVHYDMNMTNPQTRETPMMFHKEGKNDVLVSMVLESRTVSISAESSFETVAGILVNDPTEITQVNESYSTEFGDFLIAYLYKDSKPLKHTFSFVALPEYETETFYFVHDFEILNYNKEEVKSEKVEVIDDVTKTAIEPLISDAEIIDGKFAEVKTEKSVDLKTVRLVETQTKELVSELKTDESYVLSKEQVFSTTTDTAKVTIVDGNNNFVLGEIIAETTDAYSWEKFKEVRMDNTKENPHVQFVYGDWTGSFELDPDTYSSTNPTNDETIYTPTGLGTDCPTMNDSEGAFVGGDPLTVSVSTSTDGDRCRRAFVEYGISTVDDDADILSVHLKIDIDALATTTGNCDVSGMTVFRSESSSPSAVYANIASGTILVDNNNFCTAIANNIDIDLGSAGITYIEGRLAGDKAQFGFKLDSEVRGASAKGAYIESEESGTATPKPTLEIVYSTESPPSAPLNPRVYANDTSQLFFDWDAPSDGTNITGYKIWNGTDGSVINNDTATTDTFYQLSGLPSGKNQTLIVSAWNATGIGANSTSAFNSTINTAPVLTTANIINSTAFELFYSINGTFNGIQVDIDEFPYSVFTTLVGNSTSSAVSLIVNGFTESVDTAIKIFAHNIGGTSLESNEIVNATAPPEVPVLSSSAQTSSTVTLVMESNSTATSYDVYQSPSGCESFVSIINGTTSPYVVSSLSASTLYCFQTFGVNTNGTGSGSNLLNVTTSAVGESSGGSGPSGSSSDNSANQNNLDTPLTKLDVSSTKINLIKGVLTSSTIKLNWDGGYDLIIYDIDVDDKYESWFNFRSLLPITLEGSDGDKSSGSFTFSIRSPQLLCSETSPENQFCIDSDELSIPVKIFADLNGATKIDDSVIELSFVSPGSIIEYLIIGSVAFAFGTIGYWGIKSRQPPSRPKPKGKFTDRLKRASKSKPRPNKGKFSIRITKNRR